MLLRCDGSERVCDRVIHDGERFEEGVGGCGLVCSRRGCVIGCSWVLRGCMTEPATTVKDWSIPDCACLLYVCLCKCV